MKIRGLGFSRSFGFGGRGLFDRGFLGGSFGGGFSSSFSLGSLLGFHLGESLLGELGGAGHGPSLR